MDGHEECGWCIGHGSVLEAQAAQTMDPVNTVVFLPLVQLISLNFFSALELYVLM